MVSMIPGLVMRAAPFIARRVLPAIGSKVAQRAVMGASLGAYGLAEINDQIAQRVQDLVDAGYDPAIAKQIVEQSFGTTLGRAAPTLAGEALMFSGMPLGGILGTATMAAGGALQGVESGRTRGYDGLGTLSEAAQGAIYGAIPGALETATMTQLMNKRR